MRHRLTLRDLLVLVGFLGVMLAVVRWTDPAVRYREDRSAAQFFRLLKERVRNGDPVEKVEGILGPPERIAIADPRDAAERSAMGGPRSYPEGIRPTDELLTYRAETFTVVLQARLGRLVNFNPADYPIQAGSALDR